MASDRNSSYAPFGDASGPPSAPPGDHYYPPLPADPSYHQDAPPPYSFPDEHRGSGRKVPTVTPQGSPHVHPQPVASMPSATTATHPNGVPNFVATTNLPPQQPVQVVLQGDMGGALPPGVCHLCRRGKIKDSATCCSWVACFFLLPFGIIPGLIAFCYACRKPKCTRCGFVHGKKK